MFVKKNKYLIVNRKNMGRKKVAMCFSKKEKKILG